MRRSVLLAAVLAVSAPLSLSAQSSSLFGSGGNSGSGSSGFGSSGSGTTNFGSSGSGSSGLSSSGSRSSGSSSMFGGTSSSLSSGLSSASSGLSSGSGTSSTSSGSGGGMTVSGSPNAMGAGLNNSGMAGRGAGGAGFENLANSQGMQFGQLGQNLANAGFIGANQNGFIGNRMTGQQSGFSNQMMQAFQGLSRGGSGFNNGQIGSQAPKLGIRPTQRIAFNFRASTPAAATSRVTTQFRRASTRRPELAGVTTVAGDSGRVVLRGTVANDEARQLAAAMARLEPGVDDVVNELTVAPAASP